MSPSLAVGDRSPRRGSHSPRVRVWDLWPHSLVTFIAVAVVLGRYVRTAPQNMVEP